MNPSTITPSFTKLIDSGVLGALVVVLLFTVAWLGKKLLDEKDLQIKKGEQTNLVLRTVGDTMKELLIEIERNPREKGK